MRHLRTRGIVCAAASCGALQLANAQSVAEERPLSVALEYAPKPGCPDTSELKQLVVSRLGYDPFRGKAPKHVLVQVESADTALEGRVEWRDETGSWVGDQAFPSGGRDCLELVRTMAVALAVQIHLLATEAASEPASDDATPAGAEPAPTPGVPRDAAPPAPPLMNESASFDAPNTDGDRRAGSPATLALGAGATLGLGLASSVIPLARVFGRLYWPPALLELGGELGAQSTTRRADGAGFSQRVLLLSAAGCGTGERWSACLVTKGGAVRVSGRDIDVPASPSGPVLLTGARAAVRQRLGRSAHLELRAEALVNWLRWTVTLDQSVVWNAPLFVETLGFDLDVLFP